MRINAFVNYNGDQSKTTDELSRAGFDRAVLAGYPDDIVVGGRQLPGNSSELVYKAITGDPTRFIGCGYVNPLKSDAMQQLELLKDRGFAAIRVIPADGYHLDDKSLYPFWDKVADYGFVVYVDACLCSFSYADARQTRRAPNSFYNQPMKLDPISRLFPATAFVLLNMGYPLMHEAWSVHHNSRNVYLLLGGEGVSLNAPSIGYINMGGAAFIPLDGKRILYGSCYSEHMAASAIITSDRLNTMGLSWDAATIDAPHALFAERGNCVCM